MGERAVALCAAGGRYARYDAQWAGASRVVDAVDSRGPAAIDRLTDHDWTGHGTAPLLVWLAQTDYLDTEAVYLLGPAGVRVGIPVWFGVPARGRSVPSWVGAVAWSPEGAAARLRDRTAWLKGAFGRVVDAGVLSQGAAVACVWSSLAGVRHWVSPETAAFVRAVLDDGPRDRPV